MPCWKSCWKIIRKNPSGGCTRLGELVLPDFLLPPSLFLSQEVLHRIRIHEIASASYVNDDDQHLLFVKAGEKLVRAWPGDEASAALHSCGNCLVDQCHDM